MLGDSRCGSPWTSWLTDRLWGDPDAVLAPVPPSSPREVPSGLRAEHVPASCCCRCLEKAARFQLQVCGEPICGV